MPCRVPCRGDFSAGPGSYEPILRTALFAWSCQIITILELWFIMFIFMAYNIFISMVYKIISMVYNIYFYGL